MDRKIAILFMPDDMTLTKEKTPLMLQPIMFCPVLTWMYAELMGLGIERFFVVSDVRAHEWMRPYTPAGADVTYVDGAKHAQQLQKLLRGAEDRGKGMLRSAQGARRVCRVSQGRGDHEGLPPCRR